MRKIHAMTPVVLLVAALVVAGSAGAQTYKWIDESGVTNYGPNPPRGVNAQAVVTQPAGTTDSASLRRQSAEMERDERRQARSAARDRPSGMPARGMEFETYIRLQPGMTEGELVLRAGRPDHVATDSFTWDITKAYYYFPTISNPHLTVVTVRGGRIENIERTRKTY